MGTDEVREKILALVSEAFFLAVRNRDVIGREFGGLGVTVKTTCVGSLMNSRSMWDVTVCGIEDDNAR